MTLESGLLSTPAQTHRLITALICKPVAQSSAGKMEPEDSTSPVGEGQGERESDNGNGRERERERESERPHNAEM